MPPGAQGRTFARFAVRQQLLWVLGAVIPVAISMSFTDRTWGYGRGTPAADPGAFRDIDVGPLAGEGLVHFFGRADLDKVFAAFSEKTVERTSYTLGGDDKLVEWWVVVARK